MGNHDLVPVLSRENCDGFFYEYIQGLFSVLVWILKSHQFMCADQKL